MTQGEGRHDGTRSSVKTELLARIGPTPVSTEELANELGLNRGTVSRQLSELHLEGAIERSKGRGKIWSRG